MHACEDLMSSACLRREDRLMRVCSDLRRRLFETGRCLGGWDVGFVLNNTHGFFVEKHGLNAFACVPAPRKKEHEKYDEQWPRKFSLK